MSKLFEPNIQLSTFSTTNSDAKIMYHDAPFSMNKQH